MTDPVVLGTTGVSYERSAIEYWLSLHQTNPCTGALLNDNERVLIPNRALKDTIACYCSDIQRDIPTIETLISASCKLEEKNDELTSQLFELCRCGRLEAWDELNELSLGGNFTAKAFVSVMLHTSDTTVVPRDSATAAGLASEVCLWVEQARYRLNNFHLRAAYGLFYLHGVGIMANEEEAVMHFRIAAEEGSSVARCALGWCCLTGKGTARDPSEAARHFSLAINCSPGAQHGLGLCYLEGLGVDKDCREATRLLRLAVDQGYAPAQCALGGCYEGGRGVETNTVQAVELYRKAAGQGEPVALSHLHRMGVSDGKVSEEEVAKLYWACRCGKLESWNRLEQHAFSGHPTAQGYASIVLCLSDIASIPKNLRKSNFLASKVVRWAQGTADRDHSSHILFCLGYFSFEGIGNPRDDKEAVRYFKMASDRGNAAAQCSLGFCYIMGRGVEQDDNEAVKFNMLAAEQGFPAAQHNLGWCYDAGRGKPQDHCQAANYYRMAALQGYARSVCSLGVFYEYGTGVSRDMQLAVEYYKEAVEQGYAGGQTHLGLCYENAKGVPQNQAEAIRLYRLASEQGEEAASFNLGLCYEHGKGVDRSISLAIRYYRLSADKGLAKARQKLMSLGES